MISSTHPSGRAAWVKNASSHHIDHEAGKPSRVLTGECGNLFAKAGPARGGDRHETEIAVGTTGTTKNEFRVIREVGAVGQANRGEKGEAWFTLD